MRDGRNAAIYSGLEQIDDGFETMTQINHVEHAIRLARRYLPAPFTGAAPRRTRASRCIGFEAVASAVDGEALLIEQFPDTPDQQDFVVLIVSSVTASLDGAKLRELLFPIAQNVRLDATQLAHFTNGEVTLGGNRRQGNVIHRGVSGIGRRLDCE